MLNGKDSFDNDSSFIDHLIPTKQAPLSSSSRHNPQNHLYKLNGTSSQNGIFPPTTSDRRFYFAKSNGGGPPTQHQLSVDKADELQNQQQHANQLLNDNNANTTANSESAFRNPPPLNKGPALSGTRNNSTDAPSTLFPFDLPQEFPLTRTVSTSTDLNQNSDSELNYCGIFLKHVNRSSSTTTSAGGVKVRTGGTATAAATKGILKGYVGGSSKGNDVVVAANQKQKKKATPPPLLRRSKEELFNEFCRKTGRLIRPKNIYYIDDRDDEADEDDHVGRDDELQVPALNSHHLHATRLSQQSLNQMRRSKSFHDDLQDPTPSLYYSQFDRRRASSPRNTMMYQSQTLPRNFMKGSAGSGGSQSQLHIPHISRQFVNGNGYVNRSFDNFLAVHTETPSAFYQLHQPHQQHSHNWPKCIPTSPRAFYPGNRMGSALYAGGGASSRESLGKVGGADDGGGGGGSGAFDLDKIEKECRMSHASLFQVQNGFGGDYSKSTAV